MIFGRAGFFPVLFIVILLPLSFSGCRTWSSREEKAAQAFNDGNRYRESGQLEEALEAYGIALEQNPGMASAVYNSALVLVELGRSGEALELLHSLNQQDPENLTILRAMAWAAWKDGRVQASLDYSLSVLIRSPGDVDALRFASDVYDASDRAAEAVSLRKRLLEIQGDEDSRMDLARTLMLAEYYHEALENLRTILIKDNQNEEALLMASRAAEELGLFEEAVSYLLKLTDSEEEEDGEIWWRIAELRLNKTGNYDAGLKALEASLDEGFSDEDAMAALLAESPEAVRANIRTILSESR